MERARVFQLFLSFVSRSQARSRESSAPRKSRPLSRRRFRELLETGQELGQQKASQSFQEPGRVLKCSFKSYRSSACGLKYMPRFVEAPGSLCRDTCGSEVAAKARVVLRVLIFIPVLGDSEPEVAEPKSV